MLGNIEGVLASVALYLADSALKIMNLKKC